MYYSAPTWNGITVEDVITTLLKKIPKDWKIIVKEHPHIWRLRDHQNFTRELKFYKRLSENKQIILVNDKLCSKKLISGAKAIVCGSKVSTFLEGIDAFKPIYIIGEKMFGNNFKSYFELSVADLEAYSEQIASIKHQAFISNVPAHNGTDRDAAECAKQMKLM